MQSFTTNGLKFGMAEGASLCNSTFGDVQEGKIKHKASKE